MQADLDWRDGAVPVSTRFDDPYFSLAGGLEETRHVFLDGNDLPARFRDGFHVAELGFGTGLNLIATLMAWRAAGCAGRLHFTSFEAFPMAEADMARAHAAFLAIAATADEIRPHWTGDGPVRRIRLPDLEAAVIIGDVAETLPAWNGLADAWFLDGFSPAKNPGMWAPDILEGVGRHTAAGGTFATYTAAGHVRRALQAAGFAVTRRAGYGTKRHMSIGVKERP